MQTAIGPSSAHRQGSLPPVTVSVLEAPAAPEDTVVSRNIVTGNLGDGILVDSGATGTLLVRNLASRNGHDGNGIAVFDGGSRNLIQRNSGFRRTRARTHQPTPRTCTRR